MTKHTCDVCQAKFERSDHLKKHALTHSTSKPFECNVCGYASRRRDTLKRHLRARHALSNDSDIAVPAKTPRVDTPGAGDEPTDRTVEERVHSNTHIANGSSAIERLLTQHASRIRTYAKRGKRHQDLYNFQLKDGSLAELMSYVRTIYREQKHIFKLNVGLGFILQNYLTGELIYYYASTNNRLFEKSVQIKDTGDLENISERFGHEDLLEYARNQRPNTQYVVAMITNALFYVDKLRHRKIGNCSNEEMPDYILQRRSLIAFDKNDQGISYTDKLCLFRCLAYHQQQQMAGINQVAKQLMTRYCMAINRRPQDFQGIALKELPRIEDFYGVNIEVFSLEEVEDEDETGEVARSVVARKILSSRQKYPRPNLNVNLFGCHFSYIKNLNAYCRRFYCGKCEKVFENHCKCQIHERHCTNLTRDVFPGGGYGQKKTVFDRLIENGIDLAPAMCYYPYRLAFDFESLFERCHPDEPDPENHGLLSRLVPASVSICSNVPGYTAPKCFISDGSPDNLMSQMYSYMVDISGQAYALMREKFSAVLAELEQKIQARNDALAERNIALAADDAVTAGCQTALAYRLKVFEKLRDELEGWLRRVVCLGFNTGKFDFNLIRKYLFPYFLSNGVDVNYLIKKNNDYLSITTEHCVFLDIKNYLAAGTSYKQWIDSYGIEQTKGLFPYEWFTSLDKLNESRLPPPEAFRSTLRQTDITNEDYRYLQSVWENMGFRTMRDLLTWYNNLDVEPFLVAAQKLYNYWIGLRIDPFKGRAISLPGLALDFLTREMKSHTILPLFRPAHEDLYRMIRSNIVGGLSYVAHRYHERDVTALPSGELAKWISSLDCNSLYLWALAQLMGTGLYYIWRTSDDAIATPEWVRSTELPSEAKKERNDRRSAVMNHNMSLNFRRTCSYPYGKKELEWLEWMAATTGKVIEHKFNGRQKTVYFDKDTRFPVDGFIPTERTVLQFHGCYFHGHGCRWDTNSPDARAIKRGNTDNVTSKMRHLGYTVIEKWECDWDREKATNLVLNQFIQREFGLTVKANGLTAGNLVRRIENGEIFGLIECDIEVPDTNYHLLDYFEEFPPICKNTDISLEDIGDHMRAYATENGYLTRPRRNLISSHWGRKILLTTPIVRWLVAKGLIVPRVYQVIEMKPKRCFDHIAEHIADQRRLADRDPTHKPTGESWKTLGNSMYGKAMTNKARHKDSKLLHDCKVSNAINSRRFHSMEEVGDIAYEVSMDKRKITHDLPLTIAFFVYNYAKLRMLEFVYDFMKRYLRPGSFQIVCSDTDSIIAAYASPDIDSLVKPDLLQEYLTFGKRNFLATDNYTKRTPGLFKEELGATGIIALCSKTYFAWNDDDSTSKVSSKGLSKKTNHFTKNNFMDVLQTKLRGSGVNYGFVVKGDKLFLYSQLRRGLSYLYVKRRVMNDGISTTSLDL